MRSPTPTTPTVTLINDGKTKVCALPACRKHATKPRNRAYAEWVTRPYCSGGCASAARRAVPGRKTCVFCKQEFQQRDGEKNDRFKRRETCDFDCGQKLAAQRRALHGELPNCALAGCDIQLKRSDMKFCSRSHSSASRRTVDTCRAKKHPRPPDGQSCPACRKEREEAVAAKEGQPPKKKPEKKPAVPVFGLRPDGPWRPDGWTRSPMTSVPSQAWFQYDQPAGPQPKPADQEVAA